MNLSVDVHILSTNEDPSFIEGIKPDRITAKGAFYEALRSEDENLYLVTRAISGYDFLRLFHRMRQEIESSGMTLDEVASLAEAFVKRKTEFKGVKQGKVTNLKEAWLKTPDNLTPADTLIDTTSKGVLKVIFVSDCGSIKIAEYVGTYSPSEKGNELFGETVKLAKDTHLKVSTRRFTYYDIASGMLINS